MSIPDTKARIDVSAVAAEALAALDSGRQIAPFSSRLAAFELDDAYRVTAAVNHMRVTRGETPVGRKIGFTNRTIWTEYNVHGPIWGYVYDRTVHDLAGIGGTFPLADLAEPRIEPEIVFGLASAPAAGMDKRALLNCIEWVAHGFEIVQSIFPGWKFSAPDTVAAFGMHGALLIGPRRPIAARADEPGSGRVSPARSRASSDALCARTLESPRWPLASLASAAQDEDWSRSLASFEIDLKRDGVIVDHGRATDVLDGPVPALRHLVDLLARDRSNPPLAAGEIVTTGTLTRALPVSSGETWETDLMGVGLAGIGVRFA
jgi:2-keto-4-pentenoate hydratase